MEVKLQALLASALDGFEWSASLSDHLTIGKGAFCNHWIWGWV